MDWQIAAWLVQDGLTNGAIYCLLGLAIVLVFAVTRVIFVPQGEFVTFGALTLAALQSDNRPGSVWLVAAIAVLAGVANVVAALRGRDRARLGWRLSTDVALPLVIAGAVAALAPMKLPLGVDVLLTLALITPLGPTLHRIVYQPLVGASV
ncbi:MAG: branched-chain amino acid ABC transporter permease, partial [Burkholderiaceae bacterium]